MKTHISPPTRNTTSLKQARHDHQQTLAYSLCFQLLRQNVGICTFEKHPGVGQHPQWARKGSVSSSESRFALTRCETVPRLCPAAQLGGGWLSEDPGRPNHWQILTFYSAGRLKLSTPTPLLLQHDNVAPNLRKVSVIA